MEGGHHGEGNLSIELWAACSTGNEYEVGRLLDCMADPNTIDPGTSDVTVLVSGHSAPPPPPPSVHALQPLAHPNTAI